MSDALFRKCLAWSFGLHFALVFASLLGKRLTPPPIEIDLTVPYMGGVLGAPKLAAPKKEVKGAAGVAAPAEKPLDETAAPQKQDELVPGKGAVAPLPTTEEKPTPGGEEGGKGTSHLPGGEGAGSNYGVPGGEGGGGRVDVLPRLLNGDEVRANLRRFYPESERRNNNEGLVVLHLHIAADGQVTSMDVRTSAGPAFDEAARKVAALMKFAPAQSGGRPVGVLVPQRMHFKLDY